MARSPVENLDVENLSDGQLRDLIQHAREALSSRIHSRLDEFRSLAAEAGLQVTVSRIGESDTRKRGRRPRDEASGSDRRGQVAAKFQNPDNPSDRWSG